MRQLLFTILLLVAMPASAQSMKVVVDSAGNIVGRYMRANADTYTVGVQDIFDVPKSGKRVVTFRARNGQGVIWCKHLGEVDVYGTPSENGTVIGQLIYENGYVPETYRCLGRKRGWYKVEVDGRVGFVRSDLVYWDAIATF